MKTQVFLIDYENVQPDVLPALALEDVLVLVFVGPQQSKLPFALVDGMQKLGSKAEYVRVAQAGKDALDMHLAFHLGRLCCQMPEAYFHVIAKDRDYDPLLEHINKPLKRAAKWGNLNDVPMLQRFQANTLPEQVQATVRWLKERPKNRPSTQKKLANTLTKAVFAERLDEATIHEVMAQLEKRKLLTIEGQKVHYGGDLEVVGV
ncbi:MAG: hypothetical protein KGN32_01845 [Burkholderiales bacterium]|nr:hypothetical protein [Burkholderiales bacterium]